MRVIWLSLFCLVFSTSFWSALGYSKTTAKKKDKLECTAKDLKAQDCRLWTQGYTVQLLHGAVVWNDGTWHTVDPLPLKEQKVEWERVRFQFFGTHPILQFWFWGDGLGETKVQSLHWFVADAEKRKFTILSEGVVRKRRLEPLEPETFDKPRDKNQKPKFLYDPLEKHGLRSVAKNGIEWQLGDEKKLLSFGHHDSSSASAEPSSGEQSEKEHSSKEHHEKDGH
jgi:hypothetical protein